MIYKQQQQIKNTTEITEKLIVLKKKKTLRTQRKTKNSVNSVVNNFEMSSVGSVFQ